MRLFRARQNTTTPGREATMPAPETDESRPGENAGDPESGVRGERGISSVNRARPLQSRITHLLALGLMSTLGLGLLGWYYAHTFAAASAVRERGQAALKREASGSMPLPPLGSLHPPAAPSPPSIFARALGPPPPPPPPAGKLPGMGAPMSAPGYGVYPPPIARTPSPRALALARELAGPAYDTSLSSASSVTSSTPSAGIGLATGEGTSGSGEFAAPAAFTGTESSPEGINTSMAGTRASTGRLARLLTPMVTRTARPTVLPTRRLLLPKGAFIDCTLETAIDSTLPGMTTCLTATDTFSADGTVVLLPRGTELVGETRGQVQQGSARIFVLWSEARTPQGVVIPLDSPGTDALGRSGLTGTVNRHFWARFGAAILISVINGGIQYGVQSQNQGGALVYEPDTSESVMTEALKSTVDIPPTVTVPNGARIQILVARDIDFRSVYALRPTGE